ncbi:hypothetical protein [Aminithiophilus ramosus]|uniref:hypothetical protein n=1 Tax=Aminithiophilus ramosus TaxID=3029084 RepID=UPI003898FFD2
MGELERRCQVLGEEIGRVRAGEEIFPDDMALEDRFQRFVVTARELRVDCDDRLVADRGRDAEDREGGTKRHGPFPGPDVKGRRERSILSVSSYR